MTLTAIALVTAAMAAGPPPNLLVNPDFDTDLSAWIDVFLTTWDAEDVDGSPASGSARVEDTFPPFNVAGLSQCVPVVPGGAYSLRVAGLYPSGQGGGPTVHPRATRIWWDGPECGYGSSSGSGNLIEVPQDGFWTVLDFGTTAAPPWASSVQIAGEVTRDDTTITPVAHFDAFVLTGPAAIFTDTFESGGAFGWDQMVP